MKAMIVALSLATRNCPLGLLRLEAILAIRALAATPAEMVILALSKT